MLVSWYLPIPMFSLWPCVVLVIVFVPISIWHERNWRRALAAYAEVRRAAGAPSEPWPDRGLASLMGVQPTLVFVVSGLLAVVTAFGVFTAMLWPHKPPGFDLPINPYDLPFLWSMIVAGTAAVVAGVAIALDVARSPWSEVGRQVRRSMYAPAAERERRFTLALAADPGVPHGDAAEAHAAPETPPAP